MSAQYVADALYRVDTVLRRRPDMGMHDDSPAMASWCGSTRIVTGNVSRRPAPGTFPWGKAGRS